MALRDKLHESLHRLTCLAMVKIVARQVAWKIAQSRSLLLATIALITFSIAACNMASCNLYRNVYSMESSYWLTPAHALIKIWRQIAPLPSLFACLCPLSLRVAWKSLQRVTPPAMHYQNFLLNIARQVAWKIAPCNRALNSAPFFFFHFVSSRARSRRACGWDDNFR
jgi:hypothetical protein